MQQLESGNSDLLALRECLVDFKNRGMDKECMYSTLAEMRAECDEKTEDIILELMDFVTGFCRAELRIY
ncbi:MAG: hypothetical protein E7559_05815 [Ruminococcaceae bacterium]|nr:hypothetical protein [Oscillospiraceae bacterium]